MTELVNGKDVLALLFLLCQLDDLECVFCSGSLDSFWHLWLSAPIWMSAQPHKKKKISIYRTNVNSFSRTNVSDMGCTSSMTQSLFGSRFSHSSVLQESKSCLPLDTLVFYSVLLFLSSFAPVERSGLYLKTCRGVKESGKDF